MACFYKIDQNTFLALCERRVRDVEDDDDEVKYQHFALVCIRDSNSIEVEEDPATY